MEKQKWKNVLIYIEREGVEYTPTTKTRNNTQINKIYSAPLFAICVYMRSNFLLNFSKCSCYCYCCCNCKSSRAIAASTAKRQKKKKKKKKRKFVEKNQHHHSNSNNNKFNK